MAFSNAGVNVTINATQAQAGAQQYAQACAQMVAAMTPLNTGINTLNNQMGNLVNAMQRTGNQARQTAGAFAAFTAASVAADAIRGLFEALNELIVGSTLYAARTEELGVALDAVSKASGVNIEIIKQQEFAMRQLNITTQDSRQALSRFLQANLDITKSGALARTAQDLAVIAGVSTSEEINKLIIGIQTLQSRNLRTAGVFITVDEVLDNLAKTTHRARDSFSTLEKQQATLNAVLEFGARVTGTYEAAMTTASKQMRSLERVVFETQNAIGAFFVPTLLETIEAATALFTIITKYPGTFLLLTAAAVGLAAAFVAINTSAIPALIAGLSSVLVGVQNVFAAVQLLPAALNALTAATTTATGAMEAFQIAVTGFLAIGAVVAVLGVLIYNIYTAAEATREFIKISDNSIISGEKEINNLKARSKALEEYKTNVDNIAKAGPAIQLLGNYETAGSNLTKSQATFEATSRDLTGLETRTQTLLKDIDVAQRRGIQSSVDRSYNEVNKARLELSTIADSKDIQSSTLETARDRTAQYRKEVELLSAKLKESSSAAGFDIAQVAHLSDLQKDHSESLKLTNAELATNFALTDKSADANNRMSEAILKSIAAEEEKLKVTGQNIVLNLDIAKSNEALLSSNKTEALEGLKAAKGMGDSWNAFFVSVDQWLASKDDDVIARKLGKMGLANFQKDANEAFALADKAQVENSAQFDLAAASFDSLHQVFERLHPDLAQTKISVEDNTKAFYDWLGGQEKLNISLSDFSAQQGLVQEALKKTAEAARQASLGVEDLGEAIKNLKVPTFDLVGSGGKVLNFAAAFEAQKTEALKTYKELGLVGENALEIPVELLPQFVEDAPAVKQAYELVRKQFGGSLEKAAASAVIRTDVAKLLGVTGLTKEKIVATFEPLFKIYEQMAEAAKKADNTTQTEMERLTKSLEKTKADIRSFLEVGSPEFKLRMDLEDAERVKKDLETIATLRHKMGVPLNIPIDPSKIQSTRHELEVLASVFDDVRKAQNELSKAKIEAGAPVLDAQVRTETKLLQLVRDRRNEEKQLAAEIATAIHDRIALETKSGQTQALQAKAFLDNLNEGKKLQENTITALTKLSIATGDFSFADQNPIIQEGLKTANEPVVVTLTDINEVLKQSNKIISDSRVDFSKASGEQVLKLENISTEINRGSDEVHNQHATMQGIAADVKKIAEAPTATANIVTDGAVTGVENTFYNELKQELNKYLDAQSDLLQAWLDYVKGNFNQIWDTFLEWTGDLYRIMQEKFQTGVTYVKEYIRSVFGDTASGITKTISDIFSQIVTSITTAVSNFFTNLPQLMLDAIIKSRQGVQQTAEDVRRATPGSAGTISPLVLSKQSDIISVASGVMSVASGVVANAAKLTEQQTKVITDVYQTVNQAVAITRKNTKEMSEQDIKQRIAQEANKIGIPVAVALAQFKQESHFNAHAESPAGARGLAQFMPATAQRFGLTNRDDPEASIVAWGKYMTVLLKMFKGRMDLALAAYNAGEGNVQKAGNRVPQNKETPGYLANIAKYTREFGGAFDYSVDNLAKRNQQSPELTETQALSKTPYLSGLFKTSESGIPTSFIKTQTEANAAVKLINADLETETERYGDLETAMHKATIQLAEEYITVKDANRTKKAHLDLLNQTFNAQVKLRQETIDVTRSETLYNQRLKVAADDVHELAFLTEDLNRLRTDSVAILDVLNEAEKSRRQGLIDTQKESIRLQAEQNNRNDPVKRAQDIGKLLQDENNKRWKDDQELENRIAVLNAQADDKYFGSIQHRRRVEKEAAVSRLEEHNQLVTQIIQLEDQIGHHGENSALEYRKAWLEAYDAVLSREDDAVKRSLKATAEISDQSTFSIQRIRATVLESINQTQGLSESIGDLFTTTFKVYTDDIDKWIDKTADKMGNLGKIFSGFFKTVAHRAVGTIENTLLNAIFPETDNERKAKQPSPYGSAEAEANFRRQQAAIVGLTDSTNLNIETKNQEIDVTNNAVNAIVDMSAAANSATQALLSIPDNTGTDLFQPFTSNIPNNLGDFGGLLDFFKGQGTTSPTDLGISGIGTGLNKQFQTGTGNDNPYSTKQQTTPDVSLPNLFGNLGTDFLPFGADSIFNTDEIDTTLKTALKTVTSLTDSTNESVSTRGQEINTLNTSIVSVANMGYAADAATQALLALAASGQANNTLTGLGSTPSGGNNLFDFFSGGSNTGGSSLGISGLGQGLSKIFQSSGTFGSNSSSQNPFTDLLNGINIPSSGGNLANLGIPGIGGASSNPFTNLLKGLNLPNNNSLSTLSGSPVAGGAPGGILSGILGAVGLGGRGGIGGGITSLFSKGGLTKLIGGLAPQLPFIGAGLGASLGKGNPLASLLGGAGGLLLGGSALAGISALLSGGAVASTIAGASAIFPGGFAATALGGSGAAGGLGGLGAIGGLLTNPFTIAAGAALLVGAYFLGKKKQRQRDEKSRDALKGDAFKQIDQILKLVRLDKMDGIDAITQAEQIRDSYFEQVKSIKTKSVRQSAENFRPYFDSKIENIRREADLQLRRKEISDKLVPEFASGGIARQGIIKVQAGEMIIPLGQNEKIMSGREQAKLFADGGIVRGVNRGVDDTYMMAHKDALILSKSQTDEITKQNSFGMGGLFELLNPLLANTTTQQIMSPVSNQGFRNATMPLLSLFGSHTSTPTFSTDIRPASTPAASSAAPDIVINMNVVNNGDKFVLDVMSSNPGQKVITNVTNQSLADRSVARR